MMKHYNSEITSPASLFSQSPHPEIAEEQLKIEDEDDNSNLVYERRKMDFYRNVSPTSPSSVNHHHPENNGENQMVGSGNNPITTTSRNLRDIYY